jgi:hypothetical protein
MRQLMENDGIQERYGNDDEPERIFKQQVEQQSSLKTNPSPFVVFLFNIH